jgi:hypothetical protein
MSAALCFARRVGAGRLLLLHHDPLHSDDLLDSFHVRAGERWAELGGDSSCLELAVERQEVQVTPPVVGQSA